jgi:hypothetical protein
LADAVDDESLFMTNGSSQGLQMVLDLFTSEGDTIFVEDYTYFLALTIFRVHHSLARDRSQLAVTAILSRDAWLTVSAYVPRDGVQGRGLNVVGVETDEQGINVDDLEAKLAAFGRHNKKVSLDLVRSASCPAELCHSRPMRALISRRSCTRSPALAIRRASH